MFRSLFAWTALLAMASAAPVFTLPDDVTPKRYRIDLTVDPTRDTFDGFARIEVTLRNTQSTIWLNAKDLTIESARVESSGHEVAVQTEESGGEFLALQLDKPIGPGSVVLSIRYRGPLREKPVVGPYRVRFEDNWYAFTTFTPIDARRAFPCFDEPRFKTPWQLTIHVKRTDSAFSNSSAIRETDESAGMKAVQFAETEPLPSEVVAFAVGPLDAFDGGVAGSRHVHVRVITPKGHAAEGEQGARATAGVIARLEAYTGIPYPYAKLDHVAVPQAAYAAVENPGLITYRLKGLLVAPAREDQAKKPAVRLVEAHEITHQWFGDLVTQANWQDVWLSEAFATWFSQKIAAEAGPANVRNVPAVQARQGIMVADAEPKTLPVRRIMHDRESMDSVYNTFVYQKGSAVLFMLEHWLGEDRFRDGLRAYLTEHRFGNATTADLAAALREKSGADPTEVMHTFLDQSGFPEIRVKVECDHRAAASVTFEQATTKTWAIPVCWRTDAQSTSCFVLNNARKQIALPSGTGCPAFLFANADGKGYYRTVWSPDQLTALEKRGIDKLTPAERLTLTYDVQYLEKTGRLTEAIAKPLIETLAH